ncbi:cytochrome c [Paraflavitalea speifideaquila]|uniref:c-type cytochrome n=1 Tax=Paraflavitalea speifideaquila TaxID=3076558 RepID=UPI0028E95D30|nr:cytochrome c [Paraflavitalea speifideiaquila]
MNKEVGYVWQGFFLLLVILAGMGIVQLLASIKEPVEQDTLTGNAIEQPIAYIGSSNEGKKIFDDYCAQCHNVMKDMTGPALRGIEERVKDKKLLYNWIRNNPAVLKSGNRYFTDLYNQWNKLPMNVFPNLTDEEIGDILSYIRQYIVAAPSPAAQTVIIE